MQNSLVEIFSYNPTSTYQQGFVYIRQLAIHLRNAMVQKKKVLRPFVWFCVLSYRSLAILGSSGKLKLVCHLHFVGLLLQDSFQSVYNWQYIHCLRLWSRVLSETPNKDVLEPLIYPLVQVTLGVIRQVVVIKLA
jgi:nucleolar complex protein 2